MESNSRFNRNSPPLSFLEVLWFQWILFARILQFLEKKKKKKKKGGPRLTSFAWFCKDFIGGERERGAATPSRPWPLVQVPRRTSESEKSTSIMTGAKSFLFFLPSPQFLKFKKKKLIILFFLFFSPGKYSSLTDTVWSLLTVYLSQKVEKS